MNIYVFDTYLDIEFSFKCIKFALIFFPNVDVCYIILEK